MSPKKLSKPIVKPARAKALVSQLKREQNQLRRKLLMLGYLTSRLEKKKQSVYLVGGQAVETYTAGTFTTGDIDITTTDAPATENILENLGFKRVGMIWLNEKLEMAVHIVDMFPSNLSKTRTIEIGPYKVNLVGVEDLIIDRLAAAKHWKRPSDIEQAKVLYANFKNSLDMEYLKKRATEQHVLDVLEKAKHVETRSP